MAARGAGNGTDALERAIAATRCVTKYADSDAAVCRERTAVRRDVLGTVEARGVWCKQERAIRRRILQADSGREVNDDRPTRDVVTTGTNAKALARGVKAHIAPAISTAQDESITYYELV